MCSLLLLLPLSFSSVTKLTDEPTSTSIPTRLLGKLNAARASTVHRVTPYFSTNCLPTNHRRNVLVVALSTHRDDYLASPPSLPIERVSNVTRSTYVSNRDVPAFFELSDLLTHRRRTTTRTRLENKFIGRFGRSSEIVALNVPRIEKIICVFTFLVCPAIRPCTRWNDKPRIRRSGFASTRNDKFQITLFIVEHDNPLRLMKSSGIKYFGLSLPSTT